MYLFSCCNHSFSQGTWVRLDSTGRTNLEITNLNSSAKVLSFNVVLHGFYYCDTVVNSIEFKRIFMQGCTLPDSIGKPELPYYNKLFAMPVWDSISIEVKAQDSALFGGYTITKFSI
jgi:hypothetical protein